MLLGAALTEKSEVVDVKVNVCKFGMCICTSILCRVLVYDISECLTQHFVMIRKLLLHTAILLPGL